MSLLGVHLTLLLGPTVAVPASPLLMENLESVEVTHSDEGPSAFQLTFRAGRSGPFDLLDYPLLRGPQLRVFNRVILIVTFNVRPRVLFDGFITHQQLDPGNEPGGGLLTVTGEDVCVMMDKDEEIAEHPAQPDPGIVAKLLLRYARYGVVPVVIPPKVIDPPIPVERIPVQQGTDLAYIEYLGRKHGHVFYITPGPAPFTNTAYWGPPKRVGVLQKALTVNMGGQTNVSNLNFEQRPLEPVFVEGDVQDHRTNAKFPVQTFASLRLPPLALTPSWLINRLHTRTVKWRRVTSSVVSAFGEAQAMTDESNDDTVTVTGELDAARYGDLLQARGVVGLRGAGLRYDGLYYVKQVTHRLRQGTYTQSFTLSREGLGTTVPVVRP